MGSSTMGYKPTIYSPTLLRKLYKSVVFGAITNTDFQGQIMRKGQSLIIRGLPDITISDDVDGAAIDYQQPGATAQTFDINQGVRWGFAVSDVDLLQSDINFVPQWVEVARRNSAIAIDKKVLDTLYSYAHASNIGATAGVVSSKVNLGVSGGASLALDKTNVLTYLIKCAQVLNEQNWDPANDEYWMTIPEWMWALLMDSNLQNASIMGDGQSRLLNGRLGKLAGFTLYRSNQLPVANDSSSVSNTYITFGVKYATTFAMQIMDNEIIVNPITFGKWHRGRVILGWKVVKSEGLGYMFAHPA